MSVIAGYRIRFCIRVEVFLLLIGLLNPGCEVERSEPGSLPQSQDDNLGQSLETTYVEQVDFEKREAVLAEKIARFLSAFYETEELLPKIPEMSEVEKDNFENVHQRLKTEQMEKLEHLRPLDERTLGYVHVGRHGELLYAKSETTPGRIRIIRTDEGLELMTIDVGDYRWFYGKVRENGQCVLTDRYRSGLDVSSAPYTWPWTDKDGGFVAPGPDSPIATSDPTEPVRPSNAVGWLFPTRFNELVCVSPELKPILDCLWVVENGSGLDIVHSGPTQSGLYARVHGDGRIQFETPLLGTGNRDWTDTTWKILDNNDNPAYDAVALARNQFVLPERLGLEYKVWTNNGGNISIEAKPIID